METGWEQDAYGTAPAIWLVEYLTQPDAQRETETDLHWPPSYTSRLAPAGSDHQQGQAERKCRWNESYFYQIIVITNTCHILMAWSTNLFSACRSPMTKSITENQYAVKHFNFAGTIFRELRMTHIFARIKFRKFKILSWSNKSAEFWTQIHALI